MNISVQFILLTFNTFLLFLTFLSNIPSSLINWHVFVRSLLPFFASFLYLFLLSLYSSFVPNYFLLFYTFLLYIFLCFILSCCISLSLVSSVPPYYFMYFPSLFYVSSLFPFLWQVFPFAVPPTLPLSSFSPSLFSSFSSLVFPLSLFLTSSLIISLHRFVFLTFVLFCFLLLFLPPSLPSFSPHQAETSGAVKGSHCRSAKNCKSQMATRASNLHSFLWPAGGDYTSCKKTNKIRRPKCQARGFKTVVHRPMSDVMALRPFLL